MPPVTLATVLDTWVKNVSGPWLYVVTFLLTFAETGTMLFFIPGELTLIVAGVAAGAGGLNVVLLVAIACIAAVFGDGVGFWIGRRYGRKLQTSRLGRKMAPETWSRAEDLIRRRRGVIVLVGRWVGLLRSIMPATAGLSGMRYRREFLLWDIPGAVSWAAGCVILGYFLGDNAGAIVHRIGWIIAGGALLAGLVWWIKHRRAGNRQ